MTTFQAPSIPSPLTFGALGDSYGFCFEFTPKEFVDAHNDLYFHQHPVFLDVNPGKYSDDTQMQMALAEIIASERAWTPQEIAQTFIDVYKRDPRRGYSKRTEKVLSSVQNGDEFLLTYEKDTERNGAAMRSPIIGLFPDVNEVIQKSEIQAKVTHDTKSGVDSSIAASLLCHFFAYNLGAKEEIAAFLKTHLPDYEWENPWAGSVPVHGISTVRAAVSALMHNDSLSSLLRSCIEYTGDVDSVATIALASASGSNLFSPEIPSRLWDGVENKEFGLRYLVELDARVRAIVNPSRW